jgi:hypothetical protein
MRGSDADLRDVSAPIDNVAEEVGDRVIGCVDRYPCMPGPDEQLKLADRERLVSGDLCHADRGKGAACIPFDLAQGLKLLAARHPDLIHVPSA